MREWGYSAIMVFTLICAACSSKPDEPAAKPAAIEVSPGALQVAARNKPRTTAVQQTAGVSGIKLPEVNPLEVDGNLNVAGSSTVSPLTEVMYERFIREGYAGIIKTDGIGSGAGFKLFCKEGKSDLAEASRPIKPEEIEECAAIGRTPVEFRIGIDALAVVVNRNNNFLTKVTLEELAALFTAEKWSDVNPAWPNEPIQRFIPGTESGTFDFFVEKVFAQKAEPLLKAPNTQSSEDDEDLVEGVATTKYAIGFFGYAYYKQNTEYLKILSIEGAEPNQGTTESGLYPLARPLLLYSDAKIMREKPQVGAFLNFYLSHVSEEIGQVGYFPASQRTLDGAKVKWLKEMGYEALIAPQGANSNQ